MVRNAGGSCGNDSLDSCICKCSHVESLVKSIRDLLNGDLTRDVLNLMSLSTCGACEGDASVVGPMVNRSRLAQFH